MAHGGKRPGAGRPPKTVTDWRRRMEAVFQRSVSDADVQEATRVWVGMWKKGDRDAAFIWDRVIGKVRDVAEHEHTGVIRVEVEYVTRDPLAGA